MTHYCVYEHATGTVWLVSPSTIDNARREASLAGPGHEAMSLQRAKELRNAWATGRLAGINEIRG